MKMLKNHKGFTIIELIAVMIIIGVFCAFIIPRFISFDGNANDQADNYMIKATDRYETIRQTGLETGLDEDGVTDVNEKEKRLKKPKKEN